MITPTDIAPSERRRLKFARSRSKKPIFIIPFDLQRDYSAVCKRFDVIDLVGLALLRHAIDDLGNRADRLGSAKCGERSSTSLGALGLPAVRSNIAVTVT
jgi:hypothetical protein